ncbi:MAG: hypothetical protein EYC70_01140 [Planctomycetota bacterium]|nr:MAG: hypothetical protein EYC70_01140 [Planctomycetota bacterium]
MILAAVLTCACLQDAGGEWYVALRADGAMADTRFGYAVSGSQDLDGDLTGEILIGASGFDVASGNEGAALVLSGSTGSTVYQYWGSENSGSLGSAITRLPDIDNDGRDDFAFSAPNESPLILAEGSVYVMSGRTGILHLRIDGTETGAFFGNYVASACDLDLDGTPDILVGAIDSDVIAPTAGASFVFSGASGALLRTFGGALWAGNGRAGDGLGDVNGDGVPDYVISDITNGGAVTVFSGADASVLYRLQSVLPYDDFGTDVANLGDLDRDGSSDFVVGASAFLGLTTAHAYVYSGRYGTLLYELTGDLPKDQFGSSVACADDVDGDGYSDIAVGAWHRESSARGAAYLFSGYDGRQLVRLDGERDGDFFGREVSGLPDINGDGLGDVTIGAPGADNGIPGSGSVYAFALDSYLKVSPQSISAFGGGTVQFEMNFPLTEAGMNWILLASSDKPGRIEVRGLSIPVVNSPLLQQMLVNPPRPFSATTGVLDGNGDAITFAVLAPGQASGLVGETFRFAAVSYMPLRDLRLSSAGIRITVVP